MLFNRTEHECPNCRSKFLVATPEVQETIKSGERYSLLRGEDYLDEDAVAYNDARTSEEQVGVTGAADEENQVIIKRLLARVAAAPENSIIL
jgi:hypothetical protein